MNNKTWKQLLKRFATGTLILMVVITTLTGFTGAWAKNRLREQNLPPGQLVDVGGFKMHLYCVGQGSPTVILESGLNDFYVFWAKVQPEVSKTTRVCAYDRAGLGWSQESPGPRTNAAMVEQLHTLLGNAGIDGPYLLVGHSFGGINMRMFAHEYPDEVVGLVLVDSAHEKQFSRLPFMKEQATRQFVGTFRTLSMMSSFGLVALAPGSIPNRGLPEEAYQQYQAVVATTGYFSNASAETMAFYTSNLDAPESLGSLPLIVLSHGLPDLSTGLAGVQQDQFEQEWVLMQAELLSLSTNGKQVIAAASRHDIHLDQPDLVIEAILDLLQSGQE